MNNRKQIFANKLHKELCVFIFLAAFVPTIMTAVALFYLIFKVTADEVGIPESIAYTIIPAAQKVLGILCVATPIVLVVILIFAYKSTHRIIGPFDRIIKELDKHLGGGKNGHHIKVRRGDKFSPLVDKINKLIDQSK